MKELIETLHAEFKQKMAEFVPGILRATPFVDVPTKIMVMLGMRRTGKTHFLFQKIQSLLQENISIDRILHLNFEDERLSPFTQDQLGQLMDSFYTLYPQNHDQLCYFFIDEIQNIEGWPLVIRRFFDSKKVRIYLSGSSAKLLSKEIATSLRGRSLSVELWPFSFQEYLLAKGIADDETLSKSKKFIDQRYQQFCTYLIEGGFPEIVELHTPERRRILQDYVNVVVFRDIVERYHITNVSLILYMIKSLLKQAGAPFSVHKFFNDLKSQGFAVSKTTIHEYLSYIEDAYLVFTVPMYAESLRKTHVNPRKIYAIDTGLIHAYTFSFSENLGRVFENVIFLDLKRAGHEIYYYLTEERYEVDFLTRDKYGELHLYQVVWDANNPDTLERETRALAAAEKELGIKGKLITLTEYLSQTKEDKLF